MKKNKFIKFKKVVAMLMVSITTMVGTVAPILANETQVPQISKWSMGILNEGEKYGIFPITWYYEDFQKPISAEKLQRIVEGVGKKLESLELKADDTFKPHSIGNGRTKGEVVNLLYNELAKYQLSAEVKLNEYTPVYYFQERNILQGTGKDLELDKSCTVEEAAVLASKLIEDTYKIAQLGAKGFMWKATKGDNTLYLLGSIHIGDTAMYPLKQEVKDAFKASDALIVEAKLLDNQKGINDFIQQAMYSDGTTLKDHVSEDTYNKALKVFEQFGLPTEQYIQFKPWSIANDLTVITSSKATSLQGGGEAAALGVDMYFTTTALVTGKPILELEGMKYQAELFNGLAAKDQEDYLAGVLEGILTPGIKGETTSADQIALWQKQWYQGDLAGFTSSYEATLKESEDAFSKMLFGKRDKDMADKLASLLDQEGKATYFVVVGAGHLAQKDMVVDQLKNKGYAVEVFK